MTALTEFLRFPGLAERECRTDHGLDLTRLNQMRESCQEFARHLGGEARETHPRFARLRLVGPTSDTDQRAASFEGGEDAGKRRAANRVENHVYVMDLIFHTRSGVVNDPFGSQ